MSSPQVGTLIPEIIYIRERLASGELARLAGASAKRVEPAIGSGVVEERLVVEEFSYIDPDGDGIYVADIFAPAVDGLFEIITEINYGEEAVSKEIKTTLIVDPEGYVYELRDGKETRIPEATVSLFWLNPDTEEYELWPGRQYSQINPQITGARGAYAFLVPEGSYYIEAAASDYRPYKGETFEVQFGTGGVHVNIELASGFDLFGIIDWKTALLLFVALLLVINFYWDRRRRLRGVEYITK